MNIEPLRIAVAEAAGLVAFRTNLWIAQGYADPYPALDEAHGQFRNALAKLACAELLAWDAANPLGDRHGDGDWVELIQHARKALGVPSNGE